MCVCAHMYSMYAYIYIYIYIYISHSNWFDTTVMRNYDMLTRSITQLIKGSMEEEISERIMF